MYQQQPVYVQQQKPARTGHSFAPMAMGVGGGLLGGMLLGEAMDGGDGGRFSVFLSESCDSDNPFFK